MVYKIQYVYMCFRMKSATIAVIGKPGYLRIHGEIKKQDEKKDSVGQEGRILGSDRFGRRLAVPSRGDPEVDPAVCPHLDEYIKIRSNRRVKEDGTIVGGDWFTCVKCKERWERLPIPTTKEGAQPKAPPPDHHLPLDMKLWKANLEAVGLSTVKFGKYKGKNKSYHWVRMNDHGYCLWLMETAKTDPNPSKELKDIAGWLYSYDKMEDEVSRTTPVSRPRPTTAGSMPKAKAPPPPPPRTNPYAAPTGPASSSGPEEFRVHSEFEEEEVPTAAWNQPAGDDETLSEDEEMDDFDWQQERVQREYKDIFGEEADDF